jgi:hypothetical protein
MPGTYLLRSQVSPIGRPFIYGEVLHFDHKEKKECERRLPKDMAEILAIFVSAEDGPGDDRYIRK